MFDFEDTKNIEDKYAYLFLDGITLKIKSLSARNKKVILVAYGIRDSGIKEIIAFRIASSESELEWYMFVDSLYRRGLSGKRLNLAVVDGAPALSAAVGTVYPFCPVQRCWVHKLRNVSQKLPKKGAESCLDGAKKIYLADSKQSAGSIYKSWVAPDKD
ncbi:transposase, partial [bacterium]|nr:transposase [bacterium]